jgi:WASH complex subunit 7
MVVGKKDGKRRAAVDADDDQGDYDDDDDDDDGEEGENDECKEGESSGAASLGLSEETREAAKMLDEVKTTLLQHFSEDVDYFRMLVTYFDESIQKLMLATERSATAGEDAAGSSSGKRSRKRSKESHLKSFYACVPALTLSFVDASKVAKDNLDKAHKGRVAYFADDGFALGVAFILAVLKQDRAFESMHWFASVEDTMRTDADKAKAELEKLSAKERAGEGAATLEFRQRRLANAAKEFEALSFSLYGARIFFRQEDEHEDIATRHTHDQATAARAVRSRGVPAAPGDKEGDDAHADGSVPADGAV